MDTIVSGKERIVRLQECVHPRCPAGDQIYNTRRDTNAATNFALSGASIVLSAHHRPLPPFRHDANHTRYNLANELLSVVTQEPVPRDSIRDE
ncbi:9823_t:CDS:2 [Funneliformis mosseae]|uniref:9823_t:CDS:1 n=1 Tax=Funneliformis mosseae TaxID=27381 RepID=A0A9N9BQI2_FUNMO|nr:9823_t:CDS:2 [Funneliformis mosseae]